MCETMSEALFSVMYKLYNNNVYKKVIFFLVMVECSGGAWKEGGPKWLCISTAEDRESWSRYRKMGATIVSPEVIFNSVMSQTLNLSNNIIHALPTLRINCI